MERNNNGNTVLLTVIGVATLLVALVGATFAYFTATVNNRTAQSVSITTASPMGLVYTGNKLELLQAVPGDKTGDTGKEFTVQNPTSADGKTAVVQTYDLTFIVDTNTFTTKHENVQEDPNDDASDTSERTGQLKATISTTDGTITKPSTEPANHDNFTVTSNTATIDLTDGTVYDGHATPKAKAGEKYKFVDDCQIAVGATHTYNVAIEFVNFTNKNQDENQGKSMTAHIEISDPKSVATQNQGA